MKFPAWIIFIGCFALILASCSPRPAKLNNWPGSGSAYAVAYFYNVPASHGHSRGSSIITQKGLNPSANLPGDTLNTKQAETVLNAIRQFHGSQMFAKCFEPHHGVVFYGQDNKPKASVSICLLCNGIKVRPNLESKIDDMDLVHRRTGNLRKPLETALKDLEALFGKELGMPVFQDFGELKKYQESLKK